MAAVPKGCGVSRRDAALLVAYLESPNCVPRALPRGGWHRNAGAGVFEAASGRTVCARLINVVTVPPLPRPAISPINFRQC